MGNCSVTPVKVIKPPTIFMQFFLMMIELEKAINGILMRYYLNWFSTSLLHTCMSLDRSLNHMWTKGRRVSDT